jgi:hypothetical protein
MRPTNAPRSSEARPGSPKRCIGPLAVLGQEGDGQEVEEALDQPRPAVLGLAPGARVVLDGDLGDQEALGVGEDRSEPVELAVEADGLGDVAPVGLEAAVEVVQLDAGDSADGPVEELARECLAERVLPLLLPAGGEVVAVVEGVDEAGQLVGSSWRSPSIVTTAEPVAAAKPWESARALPKLRRWRRARMCSSSSASSLMTRQVPSFEPSSTKMIS